MSTLAQRLSDSMQDAGINAQELSKRANVTHTSVSYWLSGRNKGMRAETAQRVANALGVSATWLATGEGDRSDKVVVFPEEDCVLLPVLGLRASAGYGETPCWEDMEETGEKIPRLRVWFHAHHLNPDSCCFLKVKGDSMSPTIWDGDLILVNRAYQSAILSGKVYAFFIDGDIRVKRLIQKLNGNLILRSDNPDFPEEELPAEERDRFKMIGRVVDRQGFANL